MAWVKLDDGFAEHPKISELSHISFRLHVVALCYSARNLTDGVLTDRQITVVTAIVGKPCGPKHARELVAAGLWHEHPDGYQLNDYLDYNPPAWKVKEERQKARERMANVRANKQANNTRTFADPVPSPTQEKPSALDLTDNEVRETIKRSLRSA